MFKKMHIFLENAYIFLKTRFFFWERQYKHIHFLFLGDLMKLIPGTPACFFCFKEKENFQAILKQKAIKNRLNLDDDVAF